MSNDVAGTEVRTASRMQPETKILRRASCTGPLCGSSSQLSSKRAAQHRPLKAKPWASPARSLSVAGQSHAAVDIRCTQQLFISASQPLDKAHGSTVKARRPAQGGRAGDASLRHPNPRDPAGRPPSTLPAFHRLQAHHALLFGVLAWHDRRSLCKGRRREATGRARMGAPRPCAAELCCVGLYKTCCKARVSRGPSKTPKSTSPGGARLDAPPRYPKPQPPANASPPPPQPIANTRIQPTPPHPSTHNPCQPPTHPRRPTHTPTTPQKASEDQVSTRGPSKGERPKGGRFSPGPESLASGRRRRTVSEAKTQAWENRCCLGEAEARASTEIAKEPTHTHIAENRSKSRQSWNIESKIGEHRTSGQCCPESRQNWPSLPEFGRTRATNREKSPNIG